MSDSVTLREYVERIIAEHEKAHIAEHANVEQMVHEAEARVDEQDTKNDLRFASMQRDLSAVRDWQSKAIGALVVVTLLAGLFGAIVYHVLFKSP